MATIGQIGLTQYRILFLPVATLTVVGEVSLFKVLGIAVYKRAGAARWILGFRWSNDG